MFESGAPSRSPGKIRQRSGQKRKVQQQQEPRPAHPDQNRQHGPRGQRRHAPQPSLLAEEDFSERQGQENHGNVEKVVPAFERVSVIVIGKREHQHDPEHDEVSPALNAFSIQKIGQQHPDAADTEHPDAHGVPAVRQAEEGGCQKIAAQDPEFRGVIPVSRENAALFGEKLSEQQLARLVGIQKKIDMAAEKPGGHKERGGKPQPGEAPTGETDPGGGFARQRGLPGQEAAAQSIHRGRSFLSGIGRKAAAPGRLGRGAGSRTG